VEGPGQLPGLFVARARSASKCLGKKMRHRTMSDRLSAGAEVLFYRHIVWVA
jgi:hypothetical protein